jgi:hypothetical protein
MIDIEQEDAAPTLPCTLRISLRKTDMDHHKEQAETTHQYK